MARYTERAENTARMLDVNYQTSLLPQPQEFLEQSWIKLLSISHLEELFAQRYGELTRENVLDFMISDFGNPSSIVSCIRAARENARAIRGKITSEVWETQNTTWLELDQMLDKNPQTDPSSFLEWVKFRSHLFRGVVYGTMLKNESFYFMRIGTYLERADNTARILETKYDAHHELKNHRYMNPSNDSADGSFFDFYHWASLLRSVSAFEIYRQTYSDQITPQRIADLLIFNPQMPRSLMNCIHSLLDLTSEVKNQNSKEIERLIGKLKAELEYSNVDEIFEEGLDQFIERFLQKINHIADIFSNHYLIPLAVA
jgi:uncharacterized alpha-E superfamily protein